MQYPHSKSVLAALFVLCASLVLVGGASGSAVAVAPLDLNTAAQFAVLASTGISGSPAATIHGDLGLPAGAGITGVTCADVHGSIYTSDGAGPSCPPKSKTNAGLVGGALTDAGNALTKGLNHSGATAINPVLNGKNLAPGVYSFGAVASNLTGTVTLTGSPSSVWIFQASSTLITGLTSKVQLAGGAQACNVFWAVGTQATIGGTFVGTVLSGTAIVMSLGSSVSGRLLAGSAVTLADASVTRPGCDTSDGGGSSSQPSRALYCDPVTGQTYNLVVGQDKQPPYAQLNLIPAYIDPVTGAASCTFPAAAVTTTTATTTATTTTATTTTSTTTAPVPVRPAPKRVVKKHPVAKKHTVVARKRHAVLAAHVTPRRAKHTFGVTG